MWKTEAAVEADATPENRFGQAANAGQHAQGWHEWPVSDARASGF